MNERNTVQASPICSANECANSVPKVEPCCIHPSQLLNMTHFQHTAAEIPQHSFLHLFIYWCFIHFIFSVSKFLFLGHYRESKELWRQKIFLHIPQSKDKSCIWSLNLHASEQLNWFGLNCILFMGTCSHTEK